MYAKIFDSMYEGTLYGKWQAIVTLQQMLVLCDSNGVIDMTPEAISGKTSIPLEIINEGIKVLSEPDPHSRTPGEEGRRITTIDAHRPWGWVIVNHRKYQLLKSMEEKREADRIRMAEKRKTSKNSDVADSRGESRKSPTQTQTHTQTKDLKPTGSATPSAPTQKGKRTFPADFQVFKEMAEWAYELGLTDPQIDSETEKFRDYHSAQGKRMQDWEAAWRNWIRNAIKFGLPVTPPAPPQLPLAAVPQDRWWDSLAQATAKGTEIGVTRIKNEPLDKLCMRIRKELDRRKATA